MSMDAVTAAISHEVGQPLTAVSLNASAAVSWLTRAKPDVKKALNALRAASDARQRTFDIIRSIRATFAKEPGRATEFSLNDLVRDTASLLAQGAGRKQGILEAFAGRDATADPRGSGPDAARARQPPHQCDRIPARDIGPATPHCDPLGAVEGKDVLLQVSDTGAGHRTWAKASISSMRFSRPRRQVPGWACRCAAASLKITEVSSGPPKANRMAQSSTFDCRAAALSQSPSKGQASFSQTSRLH